ncbi:hypothetical protein B0H14DRAFT_2565943 [Mycena olivaceomarginata]|nr:hypothetical protein B0H14DRAFT_2565943 [Mycena olivaceomarginata]
MASVLRGNSGREGTGAGWARALPERCPRVVAKQYSRHVARERGQAGLGSDEVKSRNQGSSVDSGDGGRHSLAVAPGNEKGKVIAGCVLFSFGYAEEIGGAAPVAPDKTGTKPSKRPSDPLWGTIGDANR